MDMYILVSLMVVAAMAIDTKTAKQWLTEGNNQFTAKMFTEVCKDHEGQSVVLSAFSVLPPLAQLALASTGESHDEILRSIGLPNDNVVKEVFPVYNIELRATTGVTLKMANKIYIGDDQELNDEFRSIVRDIFDSEVQNINFNNNVQAANKINAWVEDHTNHRIKDLVNPESLDGSTRAVLVNAIYFKGSWRDKFDAALTTDRDFYVSNVRSIKTPMMHRKGDYKYGESANLDAKLLEIFYDGGASSLLIILPNKIDGITILEEKMKDFSLVSKAAKEMFEIEVKVYLPKFKIETETNLKTILTRLGVTKLFEAANARLDRLLKESSDFYISAAIQKAFIEVNEEGAEAAAANAFVGGGTSFSYVPPVKEFNANHPFVFFLQQGPYILFNGAVKVL